MTAAATAYTIGIDPGLDGGIAILVDGRLHSAHYTPATPQGHGARRVLAGELRDLLEPYRQHRRLGTGDVHVWVERVGARPGQGASSGFNFGHGAGLIEGILTALYLPYTLITPQTWKPKAGLPKGADKHASRARAQQLFPEHAQRFCRVKDDGPAEAALIAWAGAHTHTTTKETGQ